MDPSYKTSKDPVSRKWITLFMNRWQQDKSHYKTLAEEAEKVCKEFLEREGIRAEIQSRCKDYDRLEAKCINRVEIEGKQYHSVESVSADIVDLAGVRIALLFPNQYVNVGKLIDEHFDIKEVKPHIGWEQKPMSDEDVQTRSRLQSPGYVAQHYRVEFKRRASRREDLPGLIEIQVMSVLNNFWSNIVHDITYKSLCGRPSEKEENLLKGLNGLLYTGDWIVEMFHEVHDARIKEENAVFANHFELSAYLFKHEKFSGKIQQQDGGRKLGPVKVMYDLLEVKAKEQEESVQGAKPRLNTAKGLELAIKDLTLDDEPDSDLTKLVHDFGSCEVTISVLLMDHLLRCDGALDHGLVSRENHRDKKQIMWSTILWLDELFPTSFALEDHLLEGSQERDKQVVYWLCEAEVARIDFLEFSTLIMPNEISEQRQEQVIGYTEYAWRFFLHVADENAVVSFTFDLSRRGVQWEFPENFTRLGKRRVFGEDVGFPDWL